MEYSLETVEDLIETSKSLTHRHITKLQIETYLEYMRAVADEREKLMKKNKKMKLVVAEKEAQELCREYWFGLAIGRDAQIEAIQDFGRARIEHIWNWYERSLRKYEREHAFDRSSLQVVNY